jgi:5S rRNA maturation endonuclease (ribonuclease M5)
LSKDNGWNKEGDDMVSFKDAIDFAIQFSNHDPVNDKQTRKVKEKNTFVNTVKNISIDVSDKPNEVVVPRNLVIKALDIPSQYFLDRGFSKEILIKYDVGDCINSSKEMNNRAVVPVYDQNMRGMIGCTGRSIHDKCLSCNAFHNMNDKCPNDNEKWLSSKWRHSKNFKTQEHLYNYWFAKKYILASKTVVIVESPGNVWRLEEAGIHNSVAIFGSSLGYKQKALLDISGAMNIITIMDNDKAGKDAAKQIEDKCGRIYNIKHIEINANDIAEMSIDDIVTKISPQIKEYELC